MNTATPRRLVAGVILLAFLLVFPAARPTSAQTADDLDLTLTPSKTIVEVGELFTATLRLENTGTEPFGELFIFLNTPDAINPVAVNCPGTASINSCTLAGLGPGSITEILFVVQAIAKSPSGPMIAFILDGVTFTEIAQVGTPVITILGPPETTSGPIASDITRRAVTISWTTDDPSTRTVRFGLTEDYGKTRTNNKLVTEHEIRLTGLKPNTTYHVQIESSNDDGTVTSSGLTFTTLP